MTGFIFRLLFNLLFCYFTYRLFITKTEQQKTKKKREKLTFILIYVCQHFSYHLLIRMSPLL